VSSETEVKLLDGAVEYFKEDPDFPFQAGVGQFVTCFSEDRDDLSQWRGYGTGENGYAIGFKASDLWGILNTVLVRINYDSGLHAMLAARVVDAMLEFFAEAVQKYAPTDPMGFGEEFLGAWDAAIVVVAPVIKDHGFKKERECRLVKAFSLNEIPQLKFLQKATMMSRHLPLRPPSGNSLTPYRLPITEVIVGPCRHPHVSRISLATMLLQKGYPVRMVSMSKIPFQST
jgi:Protein of unknown function (DUF2971)